MKVVCMNVEGLMNRTDDINNAPLTVGKVYEVLYDEESVRKSGVHLPTQYCIIDDSGFTHAYNQDRFVPIEVVREEKLRKLLG